MPGCAFLSPDATVSPALAKSEFVKDCLRLQWSRRPSWENYIAANRLSATGTHAGGAKLLPANPRIAKLTGNGQAKALRLRST